MNLSSKKWLAAYLYYAEPWEDFLVQAVNPFIKLVFDNNLAEQFFFIRYWEGGPHIRLRFKGVRAILDDDLKPQLESYFSKYFKNHPSERTVTEKNQEFLENPNIFPNNSLLFVEYEPEVARYGGPVGIELAEKQFQVSSKTILTIIEESKNNWSYERALGFAIQLHLSFSFAFGMTLRETVDFFNFNLDRWIGWNDEMITRLEQGGKTQFLKVFENSFEKERSSIVSFVQIVWNAFEQGIEFEQDWLNKWLIQMASISDQIKRAETEKQLIIPQVDRHDAAIINYETYNPLWEILESYLHMTNNRLGILNRDESYLGYLLSKSLGQIVKS